MYDDLLAPSLRAYLASAPVRTSPDYERLLAEARSTIESLHQTIRNRDQEIVRLQSELGQAWRAVTSARQEVATVEERMREIAQRVVRRWN